MKSHILLCTACLLPILILANSPGDIAEGNNKFAFKLFGEMKTEPGKNLVCSPFSISAALAMTYAGARNETAVQMSRTMNFARDEAFHPGFKQLLDRLDAVADGKIKLNIANGLWAQKDYKFLDPYFRLVKSDYGSELKNVDFTNDAEREKTRKEINGWVERETNDRIKDLIGQGDLKSQTRLVLVNAIYFYGDWAEPFKKESTASKDFFLETGTPVNVPFMNNRGRYRYYEDAKIKAIEIPYRDNSASLVIFLPDVPDGLAAFDYEYYAWIIASLQPGEVRLSLPKFQSTSKIYLGSTLSQMGMPLAFSAAADFSGMTGNHDLCISEVIHQAFIDVDEKGTEAAAATAVIMKMTSAAPSPDLKVFNADHPFVYCIKDNVTGSILFMGRVMKPGK